MSSITRNVQRSSRKRKGTKTSSTKPRRKPTGNYKKPGIARARRQQKRSRNTNHRHAKR